MNTYFKTLFKETKKNVSKLTFYLILCWIILHTTKMFLFAIQLDVVKLFVLQQSIYRILIDFFVSVILLFIIFRSRALAITYSLLEATYIFLYLLYFSYFHQYLTFSSIVSLGEGVKAVSTLKVVFSVTFIVISILDLPLLLWLTSKKRLNDVKTFLNSLTGKSFLVTVLILLVLNEVLNFAGKKSIYHIVRNKDILIIMGRSEFIIRRYGTFLYGILSLDSFFNEKKVINQLDYGPELKFYERDKKYNVVIIQVESLDSSIIFTDYKGKAITPFLRSLINKSWFYPFVVSYHFAGATSDAEFAIINSVVPLTTYPSIKLENYYYPNSLPKKFLINGYKVFAFHNNDGFYFNRDKAFHLMGFEEYYDRVKMNLPHRGWGASDEDVFNFVKQKIKEEKKPFFYYVITMSSHGPFDIVDQYYTNESFSDINMKNVKKYFNSISYVDTQLSNFVSFLVDNFNDTHIFIFGDHSSGVEGDIYNPSVSVVEGKRVEIVPLFFIPAKSSQIKPKGYCGDVISFLDVAPSIIHAAGISATIKSYGISILSLKNEKRKIPWPDNFLDSDEVIRNLKFKVIMPVEKK
jgi:phosphoglycerol transferase MdoB-like AlkP superfamily enzyme